MNGYGAPTMYGVPVNTWNSWSAKTQQIWLQDYQRTEAQATYYTMETKGIPYQVAYAYTGLVDTATGKESVETGEATNEFIAEVQTYPDKIIDTSKDLALLGGLLLAFVLLKDK